MTPVLIAAGMRAAEDAVIASGTPSIDLMERAGAAAAQAIMRFGAPRTVNVLCGPGNNGGDGYVVARDLAGMGCDVTVVSQTVPRSADAQTNRARWTGPVVPYGVVGPADGFVDALYGLGLDRPLAAGDADEIARLGSTALTRVAIDLPSGVSTDDGAALGCPISFGMTVTFSALKPAHVLEPARSRCGRVVIADIGLGLMTTNLWRNSAPRRIAGDPQTHKYARGAVVVIAGPAGHGGAARLAALAALRSGAGLVTLACASDAVAENAARVDAVMVRAVEGGKLTAMLGDTRLRAVVVGPGLGQDARARSAVEAVLACGVPAVCDADVFSLYAGTPIRGAAVLTPHEGELARMFGALPGSRVDRARIAAALANAVVVLKGPDTVIAAPDGRAVVNAHASAALATAGSGDVLAGIIAGLIAQGMAPFDAACSGVWLHGDAGVRGGAGLIADDLPELLPTVLKALA
jgi:ADP-dependent NAD(P)H-hydrate dehydratase / NAD(P)H-hydrate epimerase